MKQYLILVLSLFITLNALSQVNFPTNALKNTFNEHQLEDIRKIIFYMDSLVIYHHPNINKSNAYHTFFDSLRINFLETESNIGQLAIDEEVKYNFMFSLDTSTFNKIWINRSPKFISTKDTTISNPPNYHDIELNGQGEILNYLKTLGRKSKYFKEVYRYIEAAGSIGPSLFAGMFYNHHYLDFEKIDDRFWAAIFYLSIEESVESKINRYYK